MHYKYLCIAGALLSCSLGVAAQNNAKAAKAKRVVADYFATYHYKHADFVKQPELKSLRIDDDKHTVTIVVGETFLQQDLTDRQVGKIYNKVKRMLPAPYDSYTISIMASGLPIENLVPGHTVLSGHALWGNTCYDGQPWVTNASLPYHIDNGLFNRHICLWASHGRYYDNKKGQWQWQRPPLFGTCEDLFTETIVVPFLIPMLEHAGAVVYTPRERDLQTQEYIVDNDNISQQYYSEDASGKKWSTCAEKGFAMHAGSYVDGENPFTVGTARMTKTTRKANGTFAKWQPTFSKAGKYAVYVSYVTEDKSIDDAHYVVMHRGQATEFRVNQKMGGSTWVYLGTFDFDQGSSVDNCVMLTNQSQSKGVVTADAVRFGGGMGNIARGGLTSGLPRTLEGARYFTQWAGAPYSVYGGRGGTDDYADDINARSRMLNWLAGGSVYVPTLDGKHVPLELSLAVHSDAGYAPNGKDLVGSLAICTTDFNGGVLSSGITRQSSKMFASKLLYGLTYDLEKKYGHWNRRYLWDRNYSETRVPEVPSAIIETLSHQNFPDMVMAQDPHFKFTMARSIYKTILRYVNEMHGTVPVVQPLPPKAPAITLSGGQQARLSWIEQNDELEPTAHPDYYIVYTAKGQQDFDNGVKVRATSMDLQLSPGICYRFKITAVNRGGESFPSEQVAACFQSNASKTILVVDGFHRLSAPAVTDNAQEQGFDMEKDPGVPYGSTIGWLGKQLVFDKAKIGQESTNGLGYTNNSLAGKVVAGNNLDAGTSHVADIAASKLYNVVSCSSYAVETGRVKMNNYNAVDLVLGLQRDMPYALSASKTFSASLQSSIRGYVLSGGKLMVSGAYIATDMKDTKESAWLYNTLKSTYGGQICTDTIQGAKGLGQQFDFYRLLNADHYAATHSDVLYPVGNAFCAMQYSNGLSAAVAYKGNDYRCFAMAFPFECIIGQENRQRLMKGIMSFLVNDR